MRDRDRLLAAIALQVGAWLHHMEERILDGTEEDAVFATDLLLQIVGDESNLDKTPEEIAAHIVKVWKAKQ